MSSLVHRTDASMLSRLDMRIPERTLNVPAEDEVGFMEGFYKGLLPAMRKENFVASAIAHGIPDFIRTDPDFNPFENIPEGYEEFSWNFRFADNPTEMDRVRMNIDSEIERLDKLESLGPGAIASIFVSAATDPINFVPIGGALIKARQLSGAKRILDGAMMSARAGLFGASAAELGLQATQETRTFGESAINVSAAVLLSAVMGSAAAAIPVAKRKALEKALEEYIEPEKARMVFGQVAGGSGEAPAGLGPSIPGSVEAGVDEIELVKAFGVERVSGLLRTSTALRILTRSPSLESRKIVSDLVDVAFRTTAEAKGIATKPSVFNLYETNFRSREYKLARRADELWTEYRTRMAGKSKAGTSGLRRSAIRMGDLGRKLSGNQDASALSRAEFMDETTRSIFLNDGKHAIPEIEEYAQFAKTELFDYTNARLEQQGRINVDEFGDPDSLKIRTSIGPIQRSEGAFEVNVLGDDLAETIGVMRGTETEDAWRLADLEVSDVDAIGKAWDIDAMESVGRHANRAGKRLESASQIDANQARVWEKLRDRGFEIERADDAILTGGTWTARGKGPVYRVTQVVKPKLPANVELTNTSFMARRYLQDQVVAKRPEIITTFAEWFKRSHLIRTGKVMSQDEARLLATQAREHILNIPGDRILYEPIAFRGSKSMKERKLLIPDELLLRLGILDTDFDRVMRSYIRTMGPDIELYQRFGSVDLDDAMKRVNAEYDKLEAATPANERAALRNKMNDDTSDLRTIWNQVRGTDTKINDDLAGWARAGRAVRRLTYATLSGGFALSALPDIGKIVMVHGLARTHGDILVPLITDFKGLRMASDEVKLLGEGVDLYIDARAHAAYELGSDYSRATRFERFLDDSVNVITRANLLAPWNAFAKQITGVATMARIHRVAMQVVEGKKVAQRDIAAMAHFGLDEKLMRRIADQPWEKRGNLRLPHTEQWTDVEALSRFRSSVSKAVNEIIVTPKPGDVPRWLSTEWGKMLGQFKTFSFASINRTLIPMLQDGDMAALNGAGVSLMLGAVVYAAKQQVRGKDISEDPAVIVREAFDRSGMAGFYSDANGILELLSRGTLGLSAITGGPILSRFAARNAMGALMGPAVGQVSDAATLFGSAVTGEWLASDTQRLRRMLIANQIFYYSRLLDVAVDEINQELGIPKRRSRR